MAWSKDYGKSAKIAADEALVQAQRAESSADYIDAKQPLIDEFTGEQTNLQTQLNDLVLQSGTDIAEVVQARGGEVTLNARLDKTNVQLAETGEQIVDASKHSYNVMSGLKLWRSQLAQLKSGQKKIINVSLIGDSIGEGNAAGTSAADYPKKGYLGLIRSAMANKYGDVGMGFIPIFYPTGAPLWTFTGWTDNSAYFGVAGKSKQSAVNGETATMEFTGNGIGIMYATRADGGILSVSIDGAAPIKINTNSATEIYSTVYNITGLENGKHTMVITSELTGNQRVWLQGAYEIKGNSGIRFNMVGLSGAKAGTLSTIYAMPSEINVWNPALTILALTANDHGGQTPLATYETNMRLLIERAKQFGDVLIASVGANVYAGAIQQVEYVNIQKRLASEYNCAFLDIFNRWGGNASYAKDTLGFIKDSVHPNDSGHADIANAFLEVLDDTNAKNQTLVTRSVSVPTTGKNTGAVITNGSYDVLSKTFEQYNFNDYRDVVILSHKPSTGSADSSAVLGTLKVLFAGRNAGGANAFGSAIYNFHYDNKGALTIAEQNKFLPVVGGVSVTMDVRKSATKNTLEMKIAPSNVQILSGSVTVVLEFLRTMNNSSLPIEVDFSSSLI